jgi:hypothetical protein
VSTPSEASPEPEAGRPPSTKEIPVVAPTGATAVGNPLPPHPNAIPPAPVPMGAAQPTGPVDFVPGLPGLGTPPVPPVAAAPPAPTASVPPVPSTGGPSWPDTLQSDVPAQGRRRKMRVPSGLGDRQALAGLGLSALALALLLVGLGLDFGGESFWSALPLWSAFALLCALLGLLAFAASHPSGNRLGSGPAWRVAAGGLVGLSVFWLLVVLPRVDTDRGFVLTAALACLGGALWIGPRTRA